MAHSICVTKAHLCYVLVPKANKDMIIYLLQVFCFVLCLLKGLIDWSSVQVFSYPFSPMYVSVNLSFFLIVYCCIVKWR